jgi:hypothetical protein
VQPGAQLLPVLRLTFDQLTKESTVTGMRELYGPWGPQEIASYLRVERATVDQWQQRGRLPQSRRVSGRPWWWADQIDDWAAETRRIPTFIILLSDGSEVSNPSAAGWMIVDDEDSALAGVRHEDGDTIHDAISRLWEAGKLPAVEIVKTEATHGAWPSDRVYLSQIRVPRSASEWADAMDKLMAATRLDAGTLISNGYASGALCWVPLDLEHPEADDERGVIASGDWVIGYDAQSGYWTAA